MTKYVHKTTHTHKIDSKQKSDKFDNKNIYIQIVLKATFRIIMTQQQQIVPIATDKKQNRKNNKHINGVKRSGPI